MTDLNNIELIEFLTFLRVEKGRSSNTIDAYQRDLLKYFDFLATKNLNFKSASKQDISQYLITLKKPAAPEEQVAGKALSAASVNRNLAAIRMFYRFLVAENKISADPSAEISSSKERLSLPDALSISQTEELIKAAATVSGKLSTQRALRNVALIELLYGTGCRISEAIDLDLDDLVAEDLIKVRGKGNKERILPLGRYAKNALDAYMVQSRPSLIASGAGSAALFLGHQGTRLSRQAAFEIVKQSAKTAKIDQKVSPHTLRHTYASHLLLGGADVRTVQELLGHASITTTQRYTHLNADTLKEVHALTHPRGR